ncbi:thermonuclease family protein [Pirellulaceae bacterium SH501]
MSLRILFNNSLPSARFGWLSYLAIAAATFASTSSLIAQEKEAAPATKPTTTTVVVKKVLDGDSVSVLELRKPEPAAFEVQIEGIDAPELAQPFGKESREALAKLLPVDSVITVTWTSKDNYGRLLAQVYDKSKKHINSEMLRQGMAWHFKRYNQSKELAALEEEAKAKKSGLWAAPDPKAPWDYRRENKTPDRPATTENENPKPDEEKPGK